MSINGWRVKYDGACSRCGLALRAGDIAVYERPTRSIRCVSCPTDGPLVEPPIDNGVAGRSARSEFERRREAREARIRARFGDRMGRVLLAVTNDPQSTRSWAKGAVGEEQLAETLAGVPRLHVLHDRRLEGTRGNIDHIGIAPAGVFVIDAKRYKGRIEIRNRGNILRSDHRLYVGRRDCSTLADGLAWQVNAVSQALGEAGIDPLPPITPVLCFVDGDWPLISPPRSFRGVRLDGPRSLRKLLTATETIEPGEAIRLTRILAAALPVR